MFVRGCLSILALIVFCVTNLWHGLCYLKRPLQMFTNSMIRPLMKSIKFLYPKLRERIFWLGTAHGWLIMVGHFHLLNPLNGNQISLPPKSFESVRQYPEEFTSQEDRDLLAVRATLSSDPASGDFIFLVIYLGFNATCLSCYRSVDKQWSRFKNLGHLEYLMQMDSFTPSLIMGRFFPAKLILNQV